MPIVIDLTKAKLIAHEKRRAARSQEFEPYDAIIMKQIPGNDLIKAEAARQAIREKYAIVQTQIDTATEIATLTQMMERLCHS